MMDSIVGASMINASIARLNKTIRRSNRITGKQNKIKIGLTIAIFFLTLVNVLLLLFS